MSNKPMSNEQIAEQAFQVAKTAVNSFVEVAQNHKEVSDLNQWIFCTELNRQHSNLGEVSALLAAAVVMLAHEWKLNEAMGNEAPESESLN